MPAVLPSANAASIPSTVRTCKRRSAHRSSSSDQKASHALKEGPSSIAAQFVRHKTPRSIGTNRTALSSQARCGRHCPRACACARPERARRERANPPGAEASPWSANRSSVSECKSNTRRRPCAEPASAQSPNASPSRTASSTAQSLKVKNAPIHVSPFEAHRAREVSAMPSVLAMRLIAQVTLTQAQRDAEHRARTVAEPALSGLAHPANSFRNSDTGPSRLSPSSSLK